MYIKKGCFYFISDDFFTIVDDPYLMKNYPRTKRPHYLALFEQYTNLVWMVPCSSKIDKYQRIINKNTNKIKPAMIVDVQNTKSALLFQDMFPTKKGFLVDQYYRNNTPVCLSKPSVMAEIENNTKEIIPLLFAGVKFNKYQPDVRAIRDLMLKY